MFAKADIAGNINIVKNLSTGEIYCYNAYDEVVSYTDAEGNVTKVVYDAQGNVTSTTDALGNSTSYTYCKDGLLTEIKDASGAVTLYEYNNKGLVSKETDALGLVTTYEYDSENRPVKVVMPDGTVTEYAYNTDGSVTRVAATKVSGEAEGLCYLYNLDGTLNTSISSSDILEYTYNNHGSVASVTKNNNHQVKLSYDDNGNMTRLEELTKGVTESVTNYAYDNRGYLTKVSNAEGMLASYISRADGLLEQVTDRAGNVTKYQYDSKEQVTGLTITSADGIVLYSESNSYNKNGSLLTQNISGNGYEAEILTYTYDALDRLLSETKNGATTSYTYDVMGNRLTKTRGDVTTAYTYDLCNKLLSETTGEEATTYSYDALGNLTAKVNSIGTTTYAYDALNQLTKVTKPDGTWQSNTYDASGIRSMITENGITTEFMTFNGLVLSGYDKTDEQTEHYYYGNSLIAVEYANNAYADLYYCLANSHGDIIGLTDTYSTLTEAYRYDAFGTLTSIKSLNENGVLAEAETALSRFLYAGEQLDTTTGFYYLRARQYDTVIGRFTQEDTYLGDGRNLYVYVRNNPLKYVDPSGRDREDVVKKVDSAEKLLHDVLAGIKEDGEYALANFYSGTENQVHEQYMLFETYDSQVSIAADYPFKEIDTSVGAGMEFIFSRKTVETGNWSLPIYNLCCLEAGLEGDLRTMSAKGGLMATFFKSGAEYCFGDYSVSAELNLLSYGVEFDFTHGEKFKVGGAAFIGVTIGIENNIVIKREKTDGIKYNLEKPGGKKNAIH